ncbi:DUF4314 domain-containing protein, partial [bacterium]|nr:DUF4314 domain-containing protein [bacterium]
MRRGLALFTLLAVALSTVSFADVTRAPITNFKFKGGSNDTASPQALPLSQHRVPVISTLDETYNAGTTWYDDQHNGTMGKMIAVDEMGWVHMVWTNGVNSGSSTRHVFYNAWNPALEEFIYAAEGGAQVDPASRGGYTSIAVHPDGHG